VVILAGNLHFLHFYTAKIFWPHFVWGHTPRKSQVVASDVVYGIIR